MVEVVCGVQFRPLEGMLAPHLGVLWDRIRTEYPTCQEVAPLAPAIEHFDDSASMELAISETPPLPRIWFIRRDETGVIQVQRDRFLHNWRKMSGTDPYPRYANVVRQFRAHLGVFDSFVADCAWRPIEPLQYELTYVNHVPISGGFESLGHVGNVLPDLSWRDGAGRFLPVPERVNWHSSFLLPNNAGRLHVIVRNTVRRDEHQPILLLELTARGFATDKSRNEMWKWFDVAHEWIVRGFADLTDERYQADMWRRQT
ncbi:MAG: TIGR04255 family protein [Phycisphaerae bacterium]|nr:TIGR04255 family protein [Phycisphaerae bacterium]